MAIIIPAILATTEEDYHQKVEKVNSSNLFKDDWVQIDIMDGEFVQNKSVETEVIKKYPIMSKVEAHLMVVDPQFWVRELKDCHISRFIAPIELEEDILDEFIAFVRTFTETEIGFSLNPETSLEKVKKYLDVVDVLLIMSVNPGKSGQEFIPEVIDKVKEAARLQSIVIEVDGGVSLENAKLLVEAGAQNLVVGSRLLNGQITQNLDKFKQILNQG